MIAYDVTCTNGHTFEGWFADNASFEDQKSRKLIDCPYCGTTRVERIPSTFAIGNRQKARAESADMMPHIDTITQLRRYIEKNFEDVGEKFADEAVKIHYGETDKRNIRGTTTQEEERRLKEEGVAFVKIPIIRYDS
ncbi:MAG: DUF1178 family protein [Deltaproteobacteria bacterium]|nr:DUF1178 family protein [Candidatus Zymogenaceae bacterium]